MFSFPRKHFRWTLHCEFSWGVQLWLLGATGSCQYLGAFFFVSLMAFYINIPSALVLLSALFWLLEPSHCFVVLSRQKTGSWRFKTYLCLRSRGLFSCVLRFLAVFWLLQKLGSWTELKISTTCCEHALVFTAFFNCIRVIVGALPVYCVSLSLWFHKSDGFHVSGWACARYDGFAIISLLSRCCIIFIRALCL